MVLLIEFDYYQVLNYVDFYNKLFFMEVFLGFVFLKWIEKYYLCKFK